MNKKWIKLLALNVIMVTYAYVTTDPLAQDITGCVLDQTTGIVYFSAEESNSAAGLLYAYPTIGTIAPSYVALNEASVNKFFKYIHILSSGYAPQLATVVAATASEDGLLNRFAIANAHYYVESNIVDDAPGNDNTYGLDPSNSSYVFQDSIDDAEILSICGDSTTVFTTVHRIHNDFLSPGSALNAYKVSIASSGITLNQNAIQRPIDSRDFIVGNVYKVKDIADEVVMCYSQELKTVYVAPKYIMTGNSSSEGVCSVAAYNYNAQTSILSFVPLHANAYEFGLSSWSSGNSADQQNVVGVIGVNKFLSTHHIEVMHTSTDRYYMILFGGHGQLFETGNQIYALPLVGPEGDYTGSLANVNDKTFKTRAMDKTQLYTAASKQAIVGGKNIPWSAENYINNMIVLKDVVYVSVNNPNEKHAAIYFSQPQYDDNGVIARWSSWQLAAPKKLGASGDTPGAVYTFAVDAVSSKVWAVPSDNFNVSKVTAWESRALTAPIRSFKKQTRSVEDEILPQQAVDTVLTDILVTASWEVKNQLDETITFIAYAGLNANNEQKIVVIRTGYDDNSVQDANFKILPSINTDEPILSMNFLKAPTTDDSPCAMLLVGTQSNLYAFLDINTDEGGYVNSIPENSIVADAHDLSQSYWTRSEWKKVLPNLLNNNISSIDNAYNDLYIVQRANNVDANDSIYRISYADIAAHTIMHVTPQVVYSTDDGKLPYVLSNIVLPSEDNKYIEHLIVGTYDGAYLVTVDGGIQSKDNNDIVTIQLISGTEHQKIISLYRNSDTEIRVVIQRIDQTLQDNTLFFKITSSGDFVSTITNSIDITAASIDVPLSNAISSTAPNLFYRSVVWSDGARKLSIVGDTLVSRHQELGISKIISEEEGDVFTQVRPTSISLVNGIVTVTSLNATLSLK